jgi:hypothetical protein
MRVSKKHVGRVVLVCWGGNDTELGLIVSVFHGSDTTSEVFFPGRVGKTHAGTQPPKPMQTTQTVQSERIRQMGGSIGLGDITAIFEQEE